MVWPTLPAMPAIEATPTIAPCGLTTPWSSSSRVIRSGAVRLTPITDVQRSPCGIVGGHVGELAVAGDAGVVHHDVDAAVLGPQVLGDPLRGVLGGDVEHEVVALELLDERERARWPPAARRRPTTSAPSRCSTRAICSPMPRLAPVTSATLPSSGRCQSATSGASVDGGADADHLPRDVRRLRRQQEGQRARDGCLGSGGDVDELDGGAAADLLAERPGEALERALGDPLGVRSVRSGVRAEDDDAAARREAAQQGLEEVAQGDQALGGGDAGGVVHEAPVGVARLGIRALGDAEPTEQLGQRPRPAGRRHRAPTTPSTRGAPCRVAVQQRRVRAAPGCRRAAARRRCG